MSTSLVVSAPGKVILTGEHAVVYGKSAIATSVGLRCFVILRQTSDKVITLNLPDLVLNSPLKKEWPKHKLLQVQSQRKQLEGSETARLKALKELSNGEVEESTHQTILELAVVVFLHLLLDIYDDSLSKLSGLEVTVLSDLPAGAGLGSSAAYAVSLSAAFLMGSEKLPHPTRKISSAIGMRKEILELVKAADSDISDLEKELSGMSWDQSHLDIINRWSLEAEKLVHGTPSGIDNTISTNGGAILYRSGHMEQLENISQLRILLINTGVPRSTKKMVAGVREKHDKFPLVVVPVLESIDSLSKEVQLLLESTSGKQSGPAQFQNLEELLQFNQHLLDALGVGHASITEVCTLARSVGLSAKLTGGGGGGCVIALIPQEMTADQIKQVQGTFERAGFACWETIIGSSGVQVHYGGSSLMENNK